MERKIGNETAWIMPTEDQTSEHNNKWIVWRSLNHLQTKMGRCKTNLKRVELPTYLQHHQCCVSMVKKKQWTIY